MANFFAGGFNFNPENTVQGSLGGTTSYTVPSGKYGFVTFYTSASVSLSGHYVGGSLMTIAATNAGTATDNPENHTFVEHFSGNDANNGAAWVNEGDVIAVSSSSGEASVSINGVVQIKSRVILNVQNNYEYEGLQIVGDDNNPNDGTLVTANIAVDLLGSTTGSNETASFNLAVYPKPAVP